MIVENVLSGNGNFIESIINKFLCLFTFFALTKSSILISIPTSTCLSKNTPANSPNPQPKSSAGLGSCKISFFVDILLTLFKASAIFWASIARHNDNEKGATERYLEKYLFAIY